MPLSRVLFWVLTGTAIASIAMGAALSTGFLPGFMILIRADWLIVICTLAFIHAFAALGSAKALERVRFPMLMQCGLAAALLSFLGSLLLLFYGFRLSPALSELLAKAIAAGTLGALWCGQFGALYRNRKASLALKVTRGLTMMLASAVVILLLWAVWWERFAWPPFDERLFQVIVTLLSLVVFGAVAGKVLAQARTLEGIDVEELESSAVMPFHAVCPRCEALQALATGKSKCVSCGLRMDVIVP